MKSIARRMSRLGVQSISFNLHSQRSFCTKTPEMEKMINEMKNDPKFIETILKTESTFVDQLKNNPTFVDQLKNDPAFFVKLLRNDPEYLVKIADKYDNHTMKYISESIFYIGFFACFSVFFIFR